MRTPVLSRARARVLLCLLVLGVSGCATLTEPSPPPTARRDIELLPPRPAPPAPPRPRADAPPSAEERLPPGTLTRLPAVQFATEPLEAAPQDLIEQIRGGFSLSDPYHPSVDTQLSWFVRNPEYLDRVFGRASLYMHHIVQEVQRRGMPMELALLPVIESAFEPFAYSRARASGLWQFIPGTGERFGLPQNWWYDGRRDVLESTRAALDYLQFLHDEFEGDWLLAIAGYNCGERCVARAVERNRRDGKSTRFWDLRLPEETRAYVPKLLAMKRLVADPSAYGLEFSPIPNTAYFTRVDIAQQIDLRLAADLAGLTAEELFELNPAYHRWATPPEGPHSLLLPIDSADLFKQNVSLLTSDELMRVTHYVVQPGDTLAELASRFRTNVMTIRMLNGLGNGGLAPGTDLRVPSGTTQLPEKVLRAAAQIDGPQQRQRRGGGRPQIHVVRRGESLWSIARRHNIDHRKLMRLNGKTSRDMLRPGERLIVSTSAGGDRRSDRRSSRDDDGLTNSIITHTVRAGDTLSTLARRYGVSVTQIASWNDISAKRVLRIGQRLKIRTNGS